MTYTCPTCQRTSHNPNDARHKYCAYCNRFATEERRDRVVWSFEHQAWWGPDHRGYTTDLAKAGRYTAQQAGLIAANSVLGDEVVIHERTAELNGEPTVKGLWQ